ncbi:MAG: VOC family protein [Polyangiaceae bacterium]
MTIQAATPYFILNGRAREAIEFYVGALGASVDALLTFGQMDQSCSEAQKDNVMHCVLKLGATTLMLSDGPGAGELPPKGLVCVALDVDDAEELRRVFAALEQGGEVVNAVFDAPWGALFGVVRDRFGVEWMLNCLKK